MIVDLKRDEKNSDFQVKLTLGAARVYQQQFNRDLFTDLYELAIEINAKPYDTALKDFKIADGKKLAEMNETEIVKMILSKVNLAELAVEKPLTLDQCDRAVNVIWAFAKNADSTLPLPEKWVDLYGVFPIRKYVNQLFDLWTAAQQGTLELKNA